MVAVREPILQLVPIASMRPTQITVGMREVHEKRRRWRAHKGKKRAEFLGKHMIPVILGPKQHSYIVDHHHLARALFDEGVKDMLVIVMADLKALAPEAFWVFLDHRGWVYPYDEDGQRRSFRAIPKSVRDLVDDPFRSLAGELRRAGGFSKETPPFSEFLWADFLRRRIERKAVEKDFAKAMEKALALAKSQEAHYLPGWCGPSSDTA